MVSITPRVLISKAEQAIVMTQTEQYERVSYQVNIYLGNGDRDTGHKMERETKTGKCLYTVECPEGLVCSAKSNVLTVLMFFGTEAMCKLSRSVRNT